MPTSVKPPSSSATTRKFGTCCATKSCAPKPQHDHDAEENAGIALGGLACDAGGPAGGHAIHGQPGRDAPIRGGAPRYPGQTLATAGKRPLGSGSSVIGRT